MLQRRSLFWTSALLDQQSLFERLRLLPKRQQCFALREKTLLLDEARFEAEVWGTRTRALHLMMFCEVMLEDRYQKLKTSGRVHFPPDKHSRSAAFQHLKRYLATSAFADLDIDASILESDDSGNYYSSFQIDTIASERATLLTILLQKYRIVHGQFPESLMELPEDNRADTLIRTDPWTGTWFVYVGPNHTPSLQLRYVNDAPQVNPGQPLLFTPGALQVRLKSYVPQPTENSSIEMYKLPANVILFLGLSDGIDWRYEQVASKVTVHLDEESGD